MMLVVVYPPEYDGTLHVHADRKRGSLEVHFELAMEPGETEEQALYRAACDIQRQINDNQDFRIRNMKEIR